MGSALGFLSAEKPCRFREAAIATLEAAERPYRIAVETPNLSTLRAAVQAKLGVACRTPLFPIDLAPLPSHVVPPLPSIACVIATADKLGPATTRLHEVFVQAILAL